MDSDRQSQLTTESSLQLHFQLTVDSYRQLQFAAEHVSTVTFLYMETSTVIASDGIVYDGIVSTVTDHDMIF